MATEPGTHIEFVNYPVLHGLESKAAGREIYVPKPHIRIRVAGYDKQSFFGPVNEQIKAQYAEEWERWQKGQEEPMTGTPLERWPQMTPEMVANLKGLNFRTVEDVAAAADFAVQKIGMGGYKLRDDARKFLSLAQAAADVGQLDELREANKEKDEALRLQGEQIATMQKQMADLLARLPKAEDEPKPRGRPRKVEA
jgi:hypothetical protein